MSTTWNPNKKYVELSTKGLLRNKEKVLELLIDQLTPKDIADYVLKTDKLHYIEHRYIDAVLALIVSSKQVQQNS